jgi:hypothetical protein
MVAALMQRTASPAGFIPQNHLDLPDHSAQKSSL